MSINFIQRSKKSPHHYFIPCLENNHQPHFVRHKALHFYSALLIAVKVIVVTFLFITLPTQAEFSTVTAYTIIDLTNQARQEQGLPVLMHSAILDQSAMIKAKDMLKQNYFSHDSPDGIKPWEWFKQAGYNYTYAGENLAMNFSEAEQAVEAWLKSPTHRENIMNNNYDEIGIAVVVGEIDGQETTIVVQHFGKSFVTPAGEEFARSIREEAPSIAGATLIGGGEAAEVTFKNINQQSTTNQIIYYTSKFFLILGIFVLINLLLTIFIRIKVQHRPIILHAILVIIIAGFMYLVKLHFMEKIVGESVKIL